MAGNNFSYLFQTRLNEVIVYYDYVPSERVWGSWDKPKMDNFKQAKPYSGDITTHARRRLKRAIECLYMITPTVKVFNRSLGRQTKFRLSHLTLTLSAKQGTRSDKEINKFILQPFMRDCKRKLGMKNYVWKAETQENGNIHYHIISDLYCDYNIVRKYWNNHQNTFRFIDDFKAVHGHDNPNSIDIHYVKNDGQLAAYLMKYIAKNNTKERKIVGKVWDCSAKLKQFKYFATNLSIEEDKVFAEALDQIQHEQYNQDYFSIIKFKDSNYIKLMPEVMKQQYIDQFRKILDEQELSFITNRSKF